MCSSLPSRRLESSKESTGNVGDTGSLPGSRRSAGEGNGNSTCLENSTDRGAWLTPRESMGVSPWDHRELDTTKQLIHTNQHPMLDPIFSSFSESYCFSEPLTFTFKSSSILALGCASVSLFLKHCYLLSSCVPLPPASSTVERQVDAVSSEQREIRGLMGSREDSWAQIIAGMSGLRGEDQPWIHKAEDTRGFLSSLWNRKSLLRPPKGNQWLPPPWRNFPVLIGTT